MYIHKTVIPTIYCAFTHVLHSTKFFIAIISLILTELDIIAHLILTDEETKAQKQ